MMKKILILLSLVPALALAYPVTPTGTTGFGYFTLNNVVTNAAEGSTWVNFVSTNEFYVPFGVKVNGQVNRKNPPWYLNIDGVTILEPLMKAAPPEPFKVPSGVYTVAVAATGSWQRFIFGSPTDIVFPTDGISYLYPSTVDAVLVQAIGGDIDCGVSTNGVVMVKTLGGEATVPSAPITVYDGSAVTINTQLSEVWFKGTGTIKITGVKE